LWAVYRQPGTLPTFRLLGSELATTRPEPNRDRYNPLSMTVLSANEVNDQQLDWTILRDGGVALYCKPEILTQDLNWLESKGYGIVSFEAGEWSCEEQMHLELKSALSFPDYYGRNLDALNECICEDLVVPDEGGLVLVFRSYDRFASAVQLDIRAGGRSFAEIVLHVLAHAVRFHMLFGRRLLIIVQSGNPRIRFDNLAPVFADWNPREWFDKNRDL
jgi:RNAse (barnase) inhibitor barstar